MVTGSLECGTAGTVWLYRRSWWLFLLQDIGSCVVVGFAAHVGAFEFEVSGGPGDAAEGAVGDELAAGAHVPLPGFALAGDERGPGPVPGFHDLEDEDAVGGCGRGGQEVVEDEQFHAFELVDLTVALALAFEPGAVDLFEHVLRSDVAVRDAVAEGGVAERLADVALVGPGAGYDDQGLPVPYPSAGRSTRSRLSLRSGGYWMPSMLASLYSNLACRISRSTLRSLLAMVSASSMSLIFSSNPMWSMDSSSMISRSLSPMAWIGYNVLDGLLRDLATKE